MLWGVHGEAEFNAGWAVALVVIFSLILRLTMKQFSQQADSQKLFLARDGVSVVYLGDEALNFTATKTN